MGKTTSLTPLGRAARRDECISVEITVSLPPDKTKTGRFNFLQIYVLSVSWLIRPPSRILSALIPNATLARNLIINSILTSESCDSGTDRIASVIDKLIEISSNSFNNYPYENIDDLKKGTLIINVQGDQPFLDPKVIKEMCSFFYGASELPSVVTPIYKLQKESIHNPSVVKVLVNKNSEAVYFSRSALPHIRDKRRDEWHLYYDYWGHVGIYGFRADILSNWERLQTSKLESSEKLEQLRFIDAGIKIKAFKVNGDFFAIDTRDQLEKARDFFK